MCRSGKFYTRGQYNQMYVNILQSKTVVKNNLLADFFQPKLKEYSINKMKFK
jgi:hypothetical protein